MDLVHEDARRVAEDQYRRNEKLIQHVLDLAHLIQTLPIDTADRIEPMLRRTIEEARRIENEARLLVTPPLGVPVLTKPLERDKPDTSAEAVSFRFSVKWRTVWTVVKWAAVAVGSSGLLLEFVKFLQQR